MNTLSTEGVVPNSMLSISFAPTTSASGRNGEMTFGGTDSSKFTGSIHYAYGSSLLESVHFVIFEADAPLQPADDYIARV